VTTDIDDEETLRQVVDRLAEKFPDLPRSELEAAARTEFEALVGRPVRDYLSILTERAAKKRLKRESRIGS
jgi:anti-sigma-K factor RskA